LVSTRLTAREATFSGDSERHEPVEQGGRERLHAVDRDALADLGEHLREAGEFVLHFACALAHRRAEQQFAARRQLGGGDSVGQRPLVGDRERAHFFELVAEELEAQRVLVCGREDVEDAAAYREFAAAGDHVDPRVSEIDELGRDARQAVAAAAGGQVDRRGLDEVVGERLEGGAHARHDDDGVRPVPFGEAA
jgi:hypothetical protein